MKKLTAFIVDDMRLIREALIKTVRWEDCGFTVIGQAGDGLEAEDEIRRLRPDLVITDIRMPGQDGLNLAERIQEFLPDSQLIVITGFDKFEYAQKSLRLGAVDIILKPINNEVLEKALLRAADRIRILTEESLQGEISPDASPSGGDASRTVGHLTQAVIRYIDEYLGDEFSLASISETFRVTPSHLCRVFKREMGESFLPYVRQRRIDRALVLLRDPALQISEIALACGFGSPELFTKIFKDTMGKTPSAFRKGQ